MPVPKPNSGESQDDFIGRCMEDETMVSEFPDKDQRSAACFDAWRNKSVIEFQGKKLHVRDMLDIATKEVDENDRTIKSIITTDCVDRDCEVVVTTGLNFEAFRKNPVVLFDHDASKVIGKSCWQRRDKGQVLAKTRFATTELAEEIFQLVKGGFLKAISIGMDFMTLKRREITMEDIKSHSEWEDAHTVIESADVLEYSFVAIPSNPEAMVVAEQKGLIRHTKDYWASLPIIERVSTMSVEREPHIDREHKRVLTAQEVEACVQNRARVVRGIL